MKNKNLVRCKHCGEIIGVNELGLSLKSKATQVGYGYYCYDCIEKGKDIEQERKGTVKKHGFVHTTLLHGNFSKEDFANFLSLKYNFTQKDGKFYLVSSPENGASAFSATLRQMDIEPHGTQVHRIYKDGFESKGIRTNHLVGRVNEKFNYKLFSVKKNCIMFNLSFDNGWEAFKNDCINCRAIFDVIERFQNGELTEQKAFENIVDCAKRNKTTKLQSVKLGRY